MGAMLRHRMIPLFTMLALALALSVGAAAPIAAQAPVTDEVVITATIPDVLAVQFPADLDFGNLPFAWDPADYDHGVYEKMLSTTLVVTSSLPFEIRQGGDDQSVGLAYLDFHLGFWSVYTASGGELIGGMGGYIPHFEVGEYATLGPYPMGFELQIPFEWTIQMHTQPVPTGMIRYVITLQVAQV